MAPLLREANAKLFGPPIRLIDVTSYTYYTQYTHVRARLAVSDRLRDVNRSSIVNSGARDAKSRDTCTMERD